MTELQIDLLSDPLYVRKSTLKILDNSSDSFN